MLRDLGKYRVSKLLSDSSMCISRRRSKSAVKYRMRPGPDYQGAHRELRRVVMIMHSSVHLPQVIEEHN
jgi:hypothetical protein